MEEDEIFDKVMGLVDLKNKLLTQRRQLLSRIFEDKTLNAEFIEFMSLSKSPLVLFILNLAYNFILLVPIKVFFLSSHNSQRARIFFLIEFVSAIIAVISGWLLFFAIHPNRVTTRIGNVLKEKLSSHSKWLSQLLEPDQLQMILYFTLNFRHGFILITRTLLGSCNMTHPAPIGTIAFVEYFSCNPQAESFVFPIDSAMMTMMVPLLFSTIYREVRIPVMATGWLLAVGSLMASAIILNSSPALIVTIIYIVLSALMIFDTYREYLLFYWLVMKLKQTIELNHQLAEENRATEIRHMIANVAHDLKTPLSSFMTGIDIITNDIKDLYEKVRVNLVPEPMTNDNNLGKMKKVSSHRWIQLDQSELIEIIEGIQSCLGNIYNTNTFMLMTVNRCLDYTKASNGLRLYPKPETIELTETLAMPVECMRTIQQQIGIQLLPYQDEGICSHLITDKQWLQENLLCLLSNAVKYSLEGDVLIRISLQQSQVVSRSKKVEEKATTRSLALQPLGAGGGSASDKYKVITTATVSNDQTLVNTTNQEMDQVESQLLPLQSLPQPEEDQLISDSLKKKPTNSDSTSSKLLPFLLLNLWTSSKRHAPEDHKIVPIHQRQSSITESTSRVSHANSTPSTTRRKPPLYPRNDNNHNKEGNTATTNNISSTTTSMATFLVIEVIDNGIGMSDESMKQIFYPFKQNQRLVGGTGLGLYSLAKRIEALEGHYGVRHREDGKKGSIFWFSIPYQPDEETATLQANHNSHTNTSGHDNIYATSSSSRSVNTLDLFPFTANTPPSATAATAPNPATGTSSPNHTRTAVTMTTTLRGTPSATTAHATTSGISKNNTTTALPSLKILLVEDTPSIAKMTSTMLRRQHHEVTVAENGQKALDLLFEAKPGEIKEEEMEEEEPPQSTLQDVTEEEITANRVVMNRPQRVANKTIGTNTSNPNIIASSQKFDVILMDFQMPVMDGLEATRCIRRREQALNEADNESLASQWHQLVIGISASSDHEIMRDAFQAGIDEFLPKPFSMDAFIEAVKRLQEKYPTPSKS